MMPTKRHAWTPHLRDEVSTAAATLTGRYESFWAELDTAGRRKLLQRGQPKVYDNRDYIYRQGHTSSYVLILLRGHAKLMADSASGQQTLLSIRSPGQLLGEDEALQRGGTTVRRATAQALQRVTAITVEAMAFQDLLNSHPPAGVALAMELRTRLNEAETRIRVAPEAANRRLARALVSLIDHNEAMRNDWTKVTLPLSQAELASWIGTSRETVERTLRGWRQRSIVRTDYRAITVLRPRDLMRIAGIHSAYLPSLPFTTPVETMAS
ncbi:Crp/Fnr family transcriptional regulator [Sphaerisporangium sp. NPDC005288]|uniref:Crp/Fnr family transcriptional regulator n=1 Tax=Sphaerisporangium sp. NPDC005288 TaxID=3155114 RepID=UPI0033A00F6B